jgi:hypothetical protein
MIDQTLIKSNFLGRDGFRWWIGQVPPIGSHGKQTQGDGWGNRFKVRIMGYHPYSENDLPNEDLPWAQCLIPTTSGSGAANVATDVKLQPGDVVFGFFLDGDNAQIPVIMGVFGRTSQVPSMDYANPFQPFTGYTNKIKEPNGTLKKNESNEQNAASQKSPRSVAPKQTKSIGNDEISFYSGIGHTIQLASGSTSSTISKISNEVNNLLNTIQNVKSVIGNSQAYITSFINSEVDKVTKKIQSVVTGLVGSMVNNVFKKIAPILNKGLKLLYNQVKAIVLAATGIESVAHLAGVAAQKAMLPPISELQKAIPCVTNTVIGTLGSIIKSILNSVVNSVTNFVTCAANQFTGALINDIIGKVSGGLSSVIGGVSTILQFFGGFSVENTLRGSDGLSGIVGVSDALNCGQSSSTFSGVTQWIIGQGPKGVSAPNFNDILSSANVLNSSSLLDNSNPLSIFDSVINATQNLNNSTSLGSCYTGPPTSCNPPTINIFGGGGDGATAIPLLGGIVGEGISRTASIIGIEITNSGSGYEFPPFVEVVDNCGQGYGAIARSIIDDEGKVTSIYLVSEGENYPSGDEENYIIDDVIIIDPGVDYSDGDLVIDNSGNIYQTQIFEGSILNVQPINTIDVTDPPVLTIKSNTGSGAILKPILTKKIFQGEVKQVIDCITN